MKETNKLIAERTLRIIEEGMYLFEDEKIPVEQQIQHSVEQTVTIAPDAFDQLELEEGTGFSTSILFKNGTTIEALLEETSGLKIGVLNFASAKNPGGGFLGGASAQEESLARSSSLYASLMKDETMYTFNRGRSTYLYSDYMIYSPEVVFWMDDSGKALRTPILADVITTPAPNKGAMIQNRRPEQIEELEKVFKIRMDKMLRLAASRKVECLILGAWGCGVFQNDPVEVASYFQELITAKYENRFQKIVFAVRDSSKNQAVYNAFSQAFELQKNEYER
ncbi:MAG: TIGR02452 family protein [Fluviicola sp.]